MKQIILVVSSAFFIFNAHSFGDKGLHTYTVTEAELRNHPCNKNNYEEFIFDKAKTDELIAKTGKGCIISNYFTGMKKRSIDRLELLHLQRAYLKNAYLVLTDLTHGLVGANLEGANLAYADLRGAFLRGANFKDANLEGADLRDTHIEGTDFEGANLKDVKIRGARYDWGTNFPGVNWFFVKTHPGMGRKTHRKAVSGGFYYHFTY